MVETGRNKDWPGIIQSNDMAGLGDFPGDASLPKQTNLQFMLVH